MLKTSVQQLLCFGIQAGTGNPALVVQHDHQDVAQRQQFARHRKLPACVFIDRSADGAIALDYYYPHARSPLCLHATLAAARLLLSPAQPQLKVRTAMHGQALTLILRGDQLYIRLAPQQLTQPAIAPDLPARLLAMPAIALRSAPVVASVGSPKLLLQVADSKTLQALAPDLAAIRAWGKAQGVNGCYVWCERADGMLEGRNFNHLEPAMEDQATGVAAGALSLHLGRPIALFQGAALGQPCLIRTELDDNAVLVGGRAEILAES
ncbi:PhzF family phenazine biosynthesis protein [Duganella qianjiadongensis]|uniref:PhzF family phenazine biosynthesis protein n=1 Tax=Duganella qianjiadongensis TaxID=2692176 RepID=A0ABW9VH52_9BURK|nr:PhzF family phenazine biosynthesis protein [Duganella qianjiadongensis]MYM38356.1 PhzF family phenazine biosynthesis protein [Duganella qianjiadongensis]